MVPSDVLNDAARVDAATRRRGGHAISSSKPPLDRQTATASSSRESRRLTGPDVQREASAGVTALDGASVAMATGARLPGAAPWDVPEAGAALSRTAGYLSVSADSQRTPLFPAALPSLSECFASGDSPSPSPFYLLGSSKAGSASPCCLDSAPRHSEQQVKAAAAVSRPRVLGEVVRD